MTIDKNWVLWDINKSIFFEKNYSDFYSYQSFFDYDFFYKEIYHFEFSFTQCIYEMDKCVLEKDDIVVDLGANVGFFSAYAASKAKKVIAIEGSPEIFSCLVKNTKEDYNNIEYLNANIVSSNDLKSSTWSNNPTKINIFIEDIFKFYNLNKIDFLKIDIEGGEYSLFDTIDKSLLKKINKIAIETHFHEKNLDLINNLNSKKIFCFDWYYSNLKQTMLYFYN